MSTTDNGQSPAAPIRLVLVDDSPLVLRLLRRGLAAFSDITLVGTAVDGEDALSLIAQTDPDVVCTDLHMPRLDGLGLVRRLMASHPKPIIVVSSALGEINGSAKGNNSDSVFELMRAGALEVTAKPRGGFEAGTPADYVALARKIRVAAGISVFRRHGSPGGHRPGADASVAMQTSPITEPESVIEMVAIGASTGGPTALLEVLSKLPQRLPVPLVGVQHIADGFLPGLARWLDDGSPVRVEIATPGQSPQPGVFYLAASNRHLILDGHGRFLLTEGPPQGGGHRPSIDCLFESIAARHGGNSLAILLTGMGRDGADGMGAVFRAGGMTVAQDESSCVVYGMPAAAIAAGHVQLVLPLAVIGPAIAEAVTKGRNNLIPNQYKA